MNKPMNKMVRETLYRKDRSEKKKKQKGERMKRKRESELLGEDAPPRMKPKTQDDKREEDVTVVDPNDEEIMMAHRADEMAGYFAGNTPKILLTTSKKPTRKIYGLINEFLEAFPSSMYYERRDFCLKDISTYASNRGFSDLLVLVEDRPRKIPKRFILSHLPEGPTAVFKISSVVSAKDIRGHGRREMFKPELVLNNFSTRLGHTVGRMFASLAPQDPNFRGRSVITFHNQRDFIFFRHHRYIFESKVGLQELGPRFVLKLLSLQRGSIDTVSGEYIWKHKTEMDTSRRRFFL